MGGAVFTLIGLNLAYMLVQFVAILLLPIGVFRYARIWVDERAASYAAVGSVLLGALAFLVYNAGQLSTTWAAPLYLLAMPYYYEWARESRWASLLKGLVLLFAAAAAHHVTLIFASSCPCRCLPWPSWTASAMRPMPAWAG